MIAPAIGLLAGLAIGAVVIFGSKSEPKVAPATSAPTQPAASITPIKPVTSGAAAQSGASGDTTSAADWEALIASAPAKQFAKLMKRALTISDATTRQQIVQALVVRWLDTDQESFLDFMDDLEFSESEGREVWPILVPAFAEALPGVSEKAASTPELDEIVQWIVEYYAEIDPAKALAWSKQWLLGDSLEAGMATIAGEMANRSPAEAMKILESIKSPDSRIDAVENIAGVMGAGDPVAALAWARSLPDEAERAAAVEEVLWSMSESNPEEAAKQLAGAKDVSDIEGVSSSIAEEWAMKDHGKALSWAESLPDGAARTQAVQGALAGWAESDPVAAFNYYQANHGSNLETAEWIFESWAFTSPDQAAAQARAITDPKMREQAVTGVVNGWLNEGSTRAVSQWVDALPPGRERDKASHVLVDTLSFDEPRPAWDRALAIHEPDIRGQAIQSAFAGLVDKDPSAARSALDQANLTPAERAALAPLLQTTGTVEKK